MICMLVTITSAKKISVVTRNQYGISAFVPLRRHLTGEPAGATRNVRHFLTIKKVMFAGFENACKDHFLDRCYKRKNFQLFRTYF